MLWARGAIPVRQLPNPTDKHVGARVRMRRLMLHMSQEKLGDALGITFQQIQKYEKGANRISASRLQQMSNILEVPIPFFFDGLPAYSEKAPKASDTPSTAYLFDFVATSDGLALIKAFVQIRQPKLRRYIVQLVEAIAVYRA